MQAAQVAVLDLEAIAISHQWPAPPVTCLIYCSCTEIGSSHCLHPWYSALGMLFLNARGMGEQVVDAVPWHGGVLLGHPCAISLLLLSDQILGIFFDISIANPSNDIECRRCALAKSFLNL